MKIYDKEIQIRSARRVEFIDITKKLRDFVKETGINNGVCYIFVPHTTAAVTINENADPDVVSDIIFETSRLIPVNSNYNHTEGNSDAHIKSSIFNVSLSVFIENNNLKLGTWQGVYFCEFDGPRQRKIWLKILGE